MLKLLSVNIERKRHLDKIIALIDRVQPDVVCMQEVFEDDVMLLAETLQNQSNKEVVIHFTPIIFKTDDGIDKTEEEYRDGQFSLMPFGNLILTTLPATDFNEQYYYGSKEDLKIHRSGVYTDIALALSSVRVKKDDAVFHIATTHFCKNEVGSVASDFQRERIVGLLEALKNLKDVIVCGDFNAPRGGEIFTLLAERYQDNIAPEYTTSLDPDLHRAGPLPYMVDGLFTTPEYKVTHMHFETGVSDHYAIVAEIERVYA